MDKLKELVKEGEAEETAERVKELLAAGQAADAILKKGLIPAMDEVGELFQKGEYYLPEMLVAARAMKEGLNVIKPELVKSGAEPVGKAVMGTVKGDLHDIGKNIVCMALEGAGMEVIDLGSDVPVEKFVKAVADHKPQILGLSALLTTTMTVMPEIVEAIKKEGLRDSVKIMIGGAPLSKEYAEKIGADFYGSDPAAGKNFAVAAVAG